MCKQNTDMELEIAQLKKEKQALLAENKELRQKIKTLEQVCTPLIQQIKTLQNQLDQNTIQTLKLKTQLNKTSANSSNPPSTDKRKIIHNSREKTNKKPGGQKNHKATTLTIPKNLDQLIKEGKAQKRIVDHTNGAKKYTIQWTIDIETTLTYTQHRYPTTEKPKISYGPNIQSLTVLLTNHGLISHNRPSDIFHDISYGQITISDATIEKFNHQAAAAVDTDALRTDLLNGPVMNVDEITVDCVERLQYNQTIPEIAVNSSFSAVIEPTPTPPQPSTLLTPTKTMQAWFTMEF